MSSAFNRSDEYETGTTGSASETSGLSRRQLLRTAAFGGVGLVAAGPLLAACSSTSSNQDTLAKAKKQGYIRVGFANEAPYGYADPSGKLTGEAPAVARAIMKKLGVGSLQGVLTEFGSLIPGLAANRFDMIAAGMFITAERCNQISFSNPDYVANEAIAVKAGNPKNLTDYKSIASSGATLGVESGAVEGQYAAGDGVKSGQIKQFPNGPTGMQALTSGRVDAFSLTAPSLNYLLATGSYHGLEVKTFMPTQNGKQLLAGGGYGFRKNDKSLLDAFNMQLAAMQKSGDIETLVKPFGFTGSTVTGAYHLTAAQLCKTSS
jgi:polar amino acid transport system substrate-binding protein